MRQPRRSEESEDSPWEEDLRRKLEAPECTGCAPRARRHYLKTECLKQPSGDGGPSRPSLGAMKDNSVSSQCGLGNWKLAIRNTAWILAYALETGKPSE